MDEQLYREAARRLMVGCLEGHFTDLMNGRATNPHGTTYYKSISTAIDAWIWQAVRYQETPPLYADLFLLK